MLFTNLNQFIVLGALLVIGWLFGFASHPGGKKWRLRYQDESESFAAYRHDSDVQLRDSNRRIAELERDHAALAVQLADAKSAAAAAVVVETPSEPVVVAPTVEEPASVEPAATQAAHVEPAPMAAAAEHSEPSHAEHAHVEPVHAAPAHAEPDPVVTPAHAPAEEPAKGWFDQTSRDHLARIRGIDGYMQTKLETLGLSRFADVEKLSAEDEMALEQRLEVPAGYIAREQWRDQAALLRAGNIEEHAARFAHT